MILRLQIWLLEVVCATEGFERGWLQENWFQREMASSFWPGHARWNEGSFQAAGTRLCLDVADVYDLIYSLIENILCSGWANRQYS